MDFLSKIDRQKLQKITLIVIAALTLLALVLLLVIIIASVDGSSPSGDINKPSVHTGDMDLETISVSSDQISKGSLVLANSEHKYSIPSDVTLLSIYEYRNSHSDGIPYSIGDIYNLKMASNALENAHNMLIALGSETGNDGIMISSSYGKQDYSKDTHTGLTMVLTVAGGAAAYLEDESNSDLKNWLTSNAHKYGFVVRYPADKAEITGVSDYTHAFRYVGLPHAKYMLDNNLCLEEYITYLKDNTSHKKMITVNATDGHTYSIYYVACPDDINDVKVPISVPNPDGSTKYSYTISGTNEGGVVITIKLS